MARTMCWRLVVGLMPMNPAAAWKLLIGTCDKYAFSLIAFIKHGRQYNAVLPVLVSHSTTQKSFKSP
jgi:hypothetical protein